MYEILLHRNAAKAYENLDSRTVARINKSIDVLKENPFYGKDIKNCNYSPIQPDGMNGSPISAS